MTQPRVYWIATFTLMFLATAASVASLAWLPERIPTHWDIHGKVDGYGSKWTVLMMPAVMLLMTGIFAGLPWLSPKGFSVDLTKAVYPKLMFIIVGLFAFITGNIIYGATYGETSSRVLVGGICVFLGLLGNLLGQVDRNFFIGIRTPWTLANEQVWIETHRLAAWLAVAGSVVAVVLLCIPAVPVFVAFIVIMVTFLYPVVHSLVLYKRLQAKGIIQESPVS